MYEILKNKYPKLFSKEIRASDVIFLCRDCLRGKYEEAIEEELLTLIKEKDWPWYARDIDHNVILTYPIFNGSKKIVDYLITSKKYDLNEYNPSLARSLCASISLKGADILDYLLTKEIHLKYRNDLIVKSLVMASQVKDEENVEKYLKYVDKLINNVDFKEVIKGIIHPSKPEVFNYFLMNHPLPNNRKIVVVKEIQQECSNFGLTENSVSNKNKLIEKFEMLTQLEKMHINVGTKKVKKI